LTILRKMGNMHPHFTSSVLILTILSTFVQCDLRFCEPEDDDLSLMHHNCNDDENLLKEAKVTFCEPKKTPACARYEIHSTTHPHPPLLVNAPGGQPPPPPTQTQTDNDNGDQSVGVGNIITKTDEDNGDQSVGVGNIITKNEKWYRLFLKKNCGQEGEGVGCNRNPSPKFGRKLRK